MNQKTGCLNIKKSRQPKEVGVELRAGGDLNRSEKPGWSAGDMNKLPRKLLRHPVSPKGVLSSKNTDLPNQQNDNIIFILIKHKKNYLKFYKCNNIFGAFL